MSNSRTLLLTLTLPSGLAGRDADAAVSQVADAAVLGTSFGTDVFQRQLSTPTHLVKLLWGEAQWVVLLLADDTARVLSAGSHTQAQSQTLDTAQAILRLLGISVIRAGCAIDTPQYRCPIPLDEPSDDDMRSMLEKPEFVRWIKEITDVGD